MYVDRTLVVLDRHRAPRCPREDRLNAAHMGRVAVDFGKQTGKILPMARREAGNLSTL
jgi:hypothetical protein